MTGDPLSADSENRSENLEGLTAEEVLDAVRRRGGKPPSLRQFRRFESLLPRAPSVRSGTKGRPRTLYRAEAVEWVEAIAAIRGTRWRKLPLDTLGFELWWRGFPVDVEKVRAYLTSELSRRLGGLGGRRRRSEDPNEVALRIVEELRRHPKARHRVLKLLLRRVGGNLDAVADGLYALILFFLGEEPEWDYTAPAGAPDADQPSPREALVKLFGFDRAVSDAGPDGTPLLEEPLDLRQLLSELRELTGGDVRRLWLPIQSALRPALEQARNDAFPFAHAMPVIAQAAERAAGRDFAGFGIFTAIYRARERYFRMLALLTMLVLRPTYAKGIAEINQVLKAEENRSRAYLAVVEALPQYRKYLRFNQEEAIATLPDHFRSKMQNDIESFLRDNPEIENALNA